MPAATFLQLQQRLRSFWEDQGCVSLGPCDRPLRIGTLSPATFLSVLDDQPWNTVQLLVNRCPRESRSSPPPLRLSYRHQLHVFLRPSPAHPLEEMRRSLRAAGFELGHRDLQFEDAVFEVPELALRGCGWRVRLDGLPVAHVNLLQSVHEVVPPDAVEIGYEMERLIMLQHGRTEIDDLPWGDGVSYGRVAGRRRRELDIVYFEGGEDRERLVNRLAQLFGEAEKSLARGLAEPAYDSFLRCCEVLEILSARQSLASLREQTWTERLADFSRRCVESRSAS